MDVFRANGKCNSPVFTRVVLVFIFFVLPMTLLCANAHKVNTPTDGHVNKYRRILQSFSEKEVHAVANITNAGNDTESEVSHNGGDDMVHQEAGGYRAGNSSEGNSTVDLKNNNQNTTSASIDTNTVEKVDQAKGSIWPFTPSSFTYQQTLQTNISGDPVSSIIKAYNSNIENLSNMLTSSYGLNNFFGGSDTDKTTTADGEPFFFPPSLPSPPSTQVQSPPNMDTSTVTITSITGTCKKESVYTVKSQEDLKKYDDDLECLYNRGTAPAKVPVGLWYGDVLKVVGTSVFNFIIATLWTGKLAVLAKCKAGLKRFYNVAYNFVSGEMVIPAFLYVGYVRNETLYVGEHDDGRKHLFLDYTLNLDSVCPANQRASPNLSFSLVPDPFPFNQMIDLVRCVGRTDDGGYILLGKSLLRDAYKFPEKGDSTLAYWSVVNYDDSAFPDPSICELRNLEEDFSYKHAAIVDQFLRLTVLDDLLQNPVETILKYIDINIRKPLGLQPLSQTMKYIDEHYTPAGVYVETEPKNFNSTREYINQNNAQNTANTAQVKQVLSGGENVAQGENKTNGIPPTEETAGGFGYSELLAAYNRRTGGGSKENEEDSITEALVDFVNNLHHQATQS